MSSSRARAPAALLVALATTACGSGPDYPSDWPGLRKPAARIGDAQCPDLGGTYALPRSLHPRGARRPNDIVMFHSFMGVNGQHPKTLAHPPKMTLVGPDANGLRVIVYDGGDRIVADRILVHGKHFVCKGQRISDARETHTRAQPALYYGRDVEGRLVGHKAFSSGGLVMLLEVIPLPTFVDDREWWRLEPVERPGPGPG